LNSKIAIKNGKIQGEKRSFLRFLGRYTEGSLLTLLMLLIFILSKIDLK
jgi:hypothetical protein